ncbi:pinensin family lanthipeptide [Ekhidna sp.]
MKAKKIKLEDLKVESFVTVVDSDIKRTLKGGTSFQTEEASCYCDSNNECLHDYIETNGTCVP